MNWPKNKAELRRARSQPMKHFLLAAAALIAAATPGHAMTKAQACNAQAILKTAPSIDMMRNKCHDPASKVCRQLHHEWHIAVAREEPKCMSGRVNLDAAAALADKSPSRKFM